ncbi:SelB C-terminal domain-containing protein [Aneurinibacillus thermoaerophilus]|nr:SelB C-terminal domain-containing protein [Aneurinibacillus thermoaerophilus]MED0679178.1 SelB C-terminal domain-containing protein [Aneurinibacillus thermoaerophilus]
MKWIESVEKLRRETVVEEILTPGAAKEVLGLSRKCLMPFLESLD